MTTFRQTLKPRYAILGGVFVAVLALLLLKLWTMQVIAGPEFAALSEQNRVREITLEAPRGRILDRDGRELVGNRATLAVLAPSGAAEDEEMLARLSALLQVAVPEIKERLTSRKEAALAPRVIAFDVPMTAAAYIAEHTDEFPGVEIQTRTVRTYPNGKLAAHVLGYTGEISEDQFSDPDFEGYDPTDIVGKAGAERSFERVLQGDRGRRVFEVDATGQPQRIIKEIEPEPGRDVRLTIDAKVQKVAEKALAQAIDDARKDGFRKAKSGAAVAIDVRTGEVVAMASLPTYDHSVFLGGVSRVSNWARRVNGRRTTARARGPAWATSGRSGAGTGQVTGPSRSWAA